MFGNKKKGASKQINSLIGKETEIAGDIDFCGGLLVDGNVTGNITAKNDEHATITISDNACITGKVQVPNIVINGKIEGNVYASNHVELAKNARVYGNVYYNLFEMEMGAEVNGNLVHVAEDEFSTNFENNAELVAPVTPLENSKVNQKIGKY